MEKLIRWVLKNKTEFIILAVILLLGAFLRLYKIGGYMTFLGDEGRDVLVVRRLLIEHHPPLIGPGTSIGNMYLGPLYYYMMAIPLLLANYSPVGPSVQIAILGVVTIFLVYYVAREWFGKYGALIAAFLYSISPTVIIYSRSSWNPNIMPFFALICVYGVWRLWQKKEYLWIPVIGISFAFTLQSHYLGLLLGPTLFLFWVFTIRKLKLSGKWISEKKKFVKYSLVGAVFFLFLMSPLVIFDIRHGGNNFKAFKTFITVRQSTVSIRPWSAIPNIWPIFENVITRLPGGRGERTGLVASVATIVCLVFIIYPNRKRLANINKSALLLILSWLGFGLIGLGLYKQHIYDHYYGFIFAAPFLIIAFISEQIIEKKNKYLSIFLFISLLGLTISNVLQDPLRFPPNMQMQRSIDVAEKVLEIAGGERFNFALIAENNYDSSYRYFLNLFRGRVVDIDAQNIDQTRTDLLLVVCEKPKDKCDPTHSPRTEIAAFGWTKIVNTWEVYGVTIFRLEHTN